jgi:hypothetical protein
MRCKNGTRKKKGECVPYPFRKRCKNGTRKNKAGNCESYVMLSKEDMDSIIEEYQLRPEAATYLRKIKLTKQSTDFYKYDPNRSDVDNLYFKVRARVADILKYGDRGTKVKFLRSME